MVMEQNREIIRRLYEDVSSGKVPTTGYNPRGMSFTQYTVSARPASLKTFNSFFNKVSSAFPDYTLTVESLIVKGDRVMARYTISGIHKGEFMGMAPTSERITIAGIDVFRLDNGKIVEHWDAAHQITALPGFAPPSTPIYRATLPIGVRSTRKQTTILSK
jgi:predicted ester cyclase